MRRLGAFSRSETKKPLTLWISGFFLQLVANQGLAADGR
ncbi:hypothetical protein P3T25_009847 [Paraburkholderia sp. GAS32]